MRKALLSLAMFLSLATYAQNYGDVITEQPAGTEYTLYGAAKGYTEFLQSLIPYDVDGAASKLVIAEDGSVYLYNPVVGFITNSWLKGTIDKETNLVTFKLPQTILADVINDDEGFPYTEYNIACKMVYNEELNTFLATPDDQDLTFTWDGEKLTMLDNQSLGVASTDGTWYGIIDEEKSYDVLTDKTIAPKNSDETLSYLMKYTTKDNEETTQPVTVAVEGNEIFVKGLSKDIPDSWVKGEIDGTKVTFSSKQYLGINDTNNSHSYFITLDSNNEMTNSMTMTYDPMDMSISSTGAIAVNYGKNKVKTSEYFKDLSFYQWEDTKEAPAAPTIKDCAFGVDGEYNIFTITLSTKTEDGIDLDADKLYYNIYFDDKLFTFTTSPYSTFDKDMSDIPYGFSDYDYFITKRGNDRIIYTYENYKKIGVQCFYLDGDKKITSKMATWGGTDGIDSVNAAENATTTWTDLSGREVKNPEKGIFIKTQKTADGTVKVSKQLFK